MGTHEDINLQTKSCMSGIKKSTIVCAAVALLMGFFVIKAEDVSKNKPVRYLPIRESLLVEKGHDITLSLELPLVKSLQQKKQGDVHIQWRKDGADLGSPGTNATYLISNADISHVGLYTAVLSGAVEAETIGVYLSVYELFEQHSNGGALTAPIGDFTAGNNTICGGTFDRYHVYTNFCGPNTANCTGVFANTSNSSKLDLDTCTNINNQIDTAIQVRQNFGFMTQVACNDNADCMLANANLSKSTNSTLETGKFYRVGIFYKSTTLGANTNVTFNWYYHN
jgi:hypothetical protein